MSDDDRRAFLARLLALGAGAALAGCGAATANGPANPTTGTVTGAGTATGTGTRTATASGPACAGIATGKRAGAITAEDAVLIQPARAFVCRDAGGLYALSALCTHKHCIVADNLPYGFSCSCHGSRFRPDGTVENGPAREPLVHYALCLDPAGQLLVDPTRIVEPTVRVRS